jgi:TRAP-type mannitol/chloroaromatic compound transport system permease small subunit
MQILNNIARGIDRLNGWAGSFIRWLVLAMVLIGAYNAIARYMTQYVGVQLANNAFYESQWYLFSIVFLLGAAYALDRDAHVRVDVLYSKLSEKGQAWIDLFGTLALMLPFSIMMLYISVPAVQNSWRVREMSSDPGGLPRYPIKTLVIFSFILLILQGLSQIIKQINILRGSPPPEGIPPQPVEPDVRHGEGV